MEKITGSIADDSLETISPEQPDAEADNIETDGAETDDVADSIITPDLNHNGIAEEIRLKDADSEQGQWL